MNPNRPLPQDPIINLFFENIPVLSGASDEVLEPVLETIQAIDHIMDQDVYVTDFYERRFRFVSDGHLFLCGRSPNDVLEQGYQFFAQAIHPDDLRMVADIHHITFEYFHNPDINFRKIAYLAFNYRLMHGKESRMICHKVLPLMIENKPQIALCKITESVRKDTGNLTVYYKENPYCDQYSFTKRKWHLQRIIELAPQEKKILIAARQGKSTKETAKILCISEQSTRNLRHELFQKLDVNTIEQAIIFSKNQQISLTF